MEPKAPSTATRRLRRRALIVALVAGGVFAAGAAYWWVHSSRSPEQVIMELFAAARANDDERAVALLSRETVRKYEDGQKQLMSKFPPEAVAQLRKTNPEMLNPHWRISKVYGQFATSSENPSYQVTDVAEVSEGKVQVTVQWTYPSGKGYPTYHLCVREGPGWKVAAR